MEVLDLIWTASWQRVDATADPCSTVAHRTKPTFEDVTFEKPHIPNNPDLKKPEVIDSVDFEVDMMD